MRTRTYTELIQQGSFENRLEYLLLHGEVGADTFGFDRYLNQDFYRSREWRFARESVIVRDNGCDLGVPDHDIFDAPIVHHMNPMTREDILQHEEWIIDPEFLITTTLQTHNAIHYGYATSIPGPIVERVPGDTNLW